MIFTSKFCFLDRFNDKGEDFFKPRKVSTSLLVQSGLVLEATLGRDGVWRCLDLAEQKRQETLRCLDE